jgi:hypothetical protein
VKQLAAALIAAQADMPAVEPNATNPHYKSRFVTLDHLIAKTRPTLTKHGLAIMQFPSQLDGAPALTTRLVHLSGEAVEDTMPLVLAKQDMQGLGGALTYARRYAWSAVLGISSEEDDDAERDAAAARDREVPAALADDPPEEPIVAKASKAQKDKLNVLVGKLRDGGYLETKHLYRKLGVPVADGTDENGVLHWGPLREQLTKQQASTLIEGLTKLEAAAAKPTFEAPETVQEKLA